MEEISYADELVRGISNKDFLADGFVLPAAFQFEDKPRSDGYCELSINWCDDEGAILEAMNKRKETNGKLQFPVGLTKLERRRMEMFLEDHFSAQRLAYERRAVENNEYHGNLLLNANTPRQLKNLISNGLSLVAGDNIIPQINEN